jgi:hypothetical protein
MATLARELRRQFESTIIQARRVAEDGARKALEQLAVHHHEPYSTMTREQGALRIRLRAHGRQLGDKLDEKRDTQTIDRITQECAYEHWHRMLFARFLAESQLLIEPESGMAISLDECRELAREKSTDWLHLASQFAVKMLPQIFRQGDPVLEVTLPPETRQMLEGLLKGIDPGVFTADDSLGWVYQFWQAEQKDEINRSEKKIGADELAAVTQLFTEDYMVLFLLHNTLGAWWAGKVLAAKPEIASQAKGEDDLRAACWVGGCEWNYLRFVREGENNPWRPAAGTFGGWPRAARNLKVLDPCEGSGHFLVFALPILVAFRMQEEGLSGEQAVDAVLRDNLFGLELDNRCTQIAAFNLAFAAWRKVGYRPLPPLNIACSGLGINAKEEDWLKLTGKDARVRETMRTLYHLFQQSPILGSLLDPKRVGGNLFATQFEHVRPLLEIALVKEQSDETTTELAVTAQGLMQAARILASEFTLIATNVPYLGRGNQEERLAKYCADFHSEAKADLATCFVDRCLHYCSENGTAALVTPQSWFFQSSYKSLRKRLLKTLRWDLVAKLGPRAFETITGEVVNVALSSLTRSVSPGNHLISVLDVEGRANAADKAEALIQDGFTGIDQKAQLSNPDARFVVSKGGAHTLLSEYAYTFKGICTGDGEHFQKYFWEIDCLAGRDRWAFQQGAIDATTPFAGREGVLLWENGKGTFYRNVMERLGEGRTSAWIRGREAWQQQGVVVRIMKHLPVTRYTGELYDNNVAVIVPKSSEYLPAVWTFCESTEFNTLVRKLNQKLSVTDESFIQVPFDLTHWNAVAAEKHPLGLPNPHSEDSRQWLFGGYPKGSNQPLQVAVARLLGYRWPRQTGSSFASCPPIGRDGLEKHADTNGVVCLNPVKGGLPSADRLRTLLADAFGREWSAAKQAELISDVGCDGQALEDWLRDEFFEQHCALFHERPFIWHIWDGLRNGFHALVNYHKLTAPNGEGQRTFEKLIYAYLGDWIKQQRDAQKRDIEGADARVAAAEHLKSELEKILEGEPPYDIFVRWKPLHEQPIGWEPDLNDGVRINIRPFMTATTLNGRGKSACILRVAPKIKWEKDRGKEPHRAKNEFPWFWGWEESDKPDFAGGKEFDGNRWNDLHYTLEFKRKAREMAKG